MLLLLLPPAPLHSSKFKFNPIRSHKPAPTLHFSSNTTTCCYKFGVFYKSSVVSIPAVSWDEEEGGSRILLSDVVVKRKRNVFRGRKWNSADLVGLGGTTALHLLCVLAPFTFNWSAFWVAFGLHFVTLLLGITLSFHRNLSHRSFKLPKWLEYFFAYCGLHALQGDPIDWVSTHRYHHQFCDTEKDPHTPLEGFWFSHMTWFLDSNTILEKRGEPNNVGDLEKQPFYKFLQTSYLIHPPALGALLYALGGLPYVVWGMNIRSAVEATFGGPFQRQRRSR